MKEGGAERHQTNLRAFDRMKRVCMCYQASDAKLTRALRAAPAKRDSAGRRHEDRPRGVAERVSRTALTGVMVNSQIVKRERGEE